MKRPFLFLFLSLLPGFSGIAQDRPNILWLITEDMSPYLSCYGNNLISTPNLDKLAKEGIRFIQAHSNGVQCSPARSTLISSMYATSLGTDIHREKRPVIDSFYFPIYLRKAGYYCTNNSKEDYNSLKTPATVWDESCKNANYFNRKNKNQPFFAVYNQMITHMTRVATRTTEGREKRTVDMRDVKVPGYIPDLPEVRDDISWNMGAVELMDQWVGDMIAKLKADGEYDNTIIFFYSDHGGTVPRVKAFVYETGGLVPLIVFFPPKWKHLAGMAQPSVTDRLVSFVDFAPTILNLAGEKIPSFMTGKPFFTNVGQKKENIRDFVISFTANQGPSFQPARSINDGKFHLIWNFQPAYPNGSRQSYQWQMPAQMAWDKANMEGKLTSELHKKFWLPAPAFELYDISRDSLETKDLATNPAYAKELKRLKDLLLSDLYKQKDIGFIPPEHRKVIQKEGDLYSVLRKNVNEVDRIIDAAALASEKNPENLRKLSAYLSDKNPVIQHWGASGICGLAKEGLISSLPKEALLSFSDDKVIIEAKCLIAESMIYKGHSRTGLDYLTAQSANNFPPAVACLQNIGKLAKPAVSRIKELMKDKDIENKFYLTSVLINCGELPYADLYKYEPKGSD